MVVGMTVIMGIVLHGSLGEDPEVPVTSDSAAPLSRTTYYWPRPWRRGRWISFPELEFLNNLWGLGTE
jgi:hypothetical protein